VALLRESVESKGRSPRVPFGKNQALP
jgi:hypothetical protein